MTDDESFSYSSSKCKQEGGGGFEEHQPPPQLKAILEPFCITMMVQGVSLLGVKGRISLI